MYLHNIKNMVYKNPKTQEDIPVMCATCALWETSIHGKKLCGEGTTTFLGKMLSEPMSKDKWSCKRCYVPNYFNTDDLFPSGKNESLDVLTAIKYVSRMWPHIMKAKASMLTWGRKRRTRVTSEIRYALQLTAKVDPEDAVFLAASLTPIINYIISLKKRNTTRMRTGDEVEWYIDGVPVSGIVKRTNKKKRRVEILVVGDDVKKVDKKYYKNAKSVDKNATPTLVVTYTFGQWYKFFPVTIKG